MCSITSLVAWSWAMNTVITRLIGPHAPSRRPWNSLEVAIIARPWPILSTAEPCTIQMEALLVGLPRKKTLRSPISTIYHRTKSRIKGKKCALLRTSTSRSSIKCRWHLNRPRSALAATLELWPKNILLPSMMVSRTQRMTLYLGCSSRQDWTSNLKTYLNPNRKSKKSTTYLNTAARIQTIWKWQKRGKIFPTSRCINRTRGNWKCVTTPRSMF